MEIVLWLFMLGYWSQLAATALLIYKVRTQRSIYGLCPDTQKLLLLATLSRVIWLFETRLSTMPLATFEVITSTVLLVYSTYLCYSYKVTCIHLTPKYLSVQVITAVCLVLCFFFHPGIKNEYYLSMQMLVSFSMFMESAGLLPQFVLMRKVGEVEGMTGHYVMSLGLARIFRLLFWIMMYVDGETFGHLIAADALHTVLLVDFAYVYFKSIRNNKPILLT